MGWAAIITLILQTFGPLLVEWLKKWLEDRLKKASTMVAAPESFGDDTDRQEVLLRAVLQDTPRRMVLRRVMLRNMIAALKDPVAMEDVREIAAMTAAEE